METTYFQTFLFYKDHSVFITLSNLECQLTSRQFWELAPASSKVSSEFTSETVRSRTLDALFPPLPPITRCRQCCQDLLKNIKLSSKFQLHFGT